MIVPNSQPINNSLFLVIGESSISNTTGSPGEIVPDASKKEHRQTKDDSSWMRV